MKIRNATITGTMLGIEDHGCLTAFVHLDYGGSGQGFGGYSFGSHDISKPLTHPAAGEFIRRVLKIAGVDEWEKLRGRPVRVQADHGKVHEIGHFLNDEWFNPSEIFADMEAQEPTP